MKFEWITAMLADLLFVDREGIRLFVGMVQHNSGQWQSFGCYPDMKHVPFRALGFHATREIARDVAMDEARRQYAAPVEANGPQVSTDERRSEAAAEECGQLLEAVA